MGDSPRIHFSLGGETRRAYLGIEELRLLRRATGLGPFGLTKSLETDPDPDHVRAVVFYGLCGADTDPKDAGEIADYFAYPPRPMREANDAAFAICVAAWVGAYPESDDDTGEGSDEFDLDRLMAEAVTMGVDPNDMSVAEFYKFRKKWLEIHQPQEASQEDLLKIIEDLEGGSSN